MRMLILVCTLALVAGCGAGPADTISRRPPLTVAEAMPPGAEVMPPVFVPDSPEPQADLPAQCAPGAGFDARAISLRPPATMPQPGVMPPDSTMAKILKRGRLQVGVDQNLNLISSRDPHTGVIEGYDIDFAREIARAIFGDPEKIQLRAVTFTNNFDVLKNNEIDLLADSLTITCERRYKLGVAFSTNYLDSGQRVIVRKRSPYQGPQDLIGGKVCAPAKTTSIQRIREYGTPGRRLVPVAVTEFSDCLVLLQQGQIDAISTTDTVLQGMVEQDPTLRLAGDRMSDEPHGLAMRDTEPDMVRFVNGVLEQMRNDGRWAAIYAKWLGRLPPEREFPPRAAYID